MRKSYSIIVGMIVSVALAVPFAASAFSDVSPQHPHMRAIEYLREQGVAQGYSDNSFHPDAVINRAEFTKIVMGAILGQGQFSECIQRYELQFSDVPAFVWFAPYVCRAQQRRIIEGYPDGTFRPENNINVAEAAKIIVQAFELPVQQDLNLWYRPYLTVLAERSALPSDLSTVDALLTRGQMAEIIWRIRGGVTSEPSALVEDLLYHNCLSSQQQVIPGVAIDQVRKTWLAWVNVERAREGLEPYLLDPQLSRTAAIWSNQSVGKDSMTHVREGQLSSGMYDFDAIEAWFKVQGVVFANRDRHTFTENIGWGVYSCAKADCTQEMIDAIRFTFDLYLGEQNEEEQPHYSAIMSPYFQRTGIGIAVDPLKKMYYLTVHYGTWLVEKPNQEVCQ